MRKTFSRALGALVTATVTCFAPHANAALVTLDDWTAGQSVTASIATPTVASTMPAMVLGVAPFFGDRTLTAHLTNTGNSVQAFIGGGFFECNRSSTAEGFCVVEYDVLSNIALSSIEYFALNDGANNGTASVEFYKNSTLLASQNITATNDLFGLSYSTNLGGASFSSVDSFSIRLVGSVAIDQSLKPIEGNLVPEPGSLALAGFALVALGANRRRKLLTA